LQGVGAFLRDPPERLFPNSVRIAGAMAANRNGVEALPDAGDTRLARAIACYTAGICSDASWLSLLSHTSEIQTASGSEGSRATT